MKKFKPESFTLPGSGKLAQCNAHDATTEKWQQRESGMDRRRSGGMNTRSGICRCHCHCCCILFVLISLRSSPSEFVVVASSGGATSAAALPPYCSATVGILASCYFYAWPHEKLSSSYICHISDGPQSPAGYRGVQVARSPNFCCSAPLRSDSIVARVAGAGGCGSCNAAVAAAVACEVRTSAVVDLVEFRIVCVLTLYLCSRWCPCAILSLAHGRTRLIRFFLFPSSSYL